MLDRPMACEPSERIDCCSQNSGKMSIVTFEGSEKQNAVLKTLKEGLESTPGVTATRGMAWVVEGKRNYRNDAALKDKDPGVFKMFAVPLRSSRIERRRNILVFLLSERASRYVARVLARTQVKSTRSSNGNQHDFDSCPTLCVCKWRLGDAQREAVAVRRVSSDRRGDHDLS